MGAVAVRLIAPASPPAGELLQVRQRKCCIALSRPCNVASSDGPACTSNLTEVQTRSDGKQHGEGTLRQ
jgi:hypothetical protein